MTFLRQSGETSSLRLSNTRHTCRHASRSDMPPLRRRSRAAPFVDGGPRRRSRLLTAMATPRDVHRPDRLLTAAAPSNHRLVTVAGAGFGVRRLDAALDGWP